MNYVEKLVSSLSNSQSKMVSALIWYPATITKSSQTSSQDRPCLEFLPLEIKCLILLQLSSVKTLRNLIHGSPLFRRAFGDAPEEILTQVTIGDLVARGINLLKLGDVCEVSMKKTDDKPCACRQIPVPANRRWILDGCHESKDNSIRPVHLCPIQGIVNISLINI